MSSAVEQIRHYSDRNTDRFLRYGQGGAFGARRWLDRFRRGWHVHTLLAPAQTGELAGTAGLRETIELTPYLELGRARDIGIAALMRALGWLPIASPTFDSFLGGHALQLCLERGYLGHTVLVLERLPPAGGQRH